MGGVLVYDPVRLLHHRTAWLGLLSWLLKTPMVTLANDKKMLCTHMLNSLNELSPAEG